MESKLCLVVGDGNFSFSVSFHRKKEHTTWKITATSFEIEDKVLCHHGAHENVRVLKDGGVEIIYELDGTKMEEYDLLKDKQFDLIVFNFPHAGGKNNIKRNCNLLQGFLNSASKMLTPSGEVWVALCKGQGGTPLDNTQRGYENSWKIVHVAAEAGFILSDIQPFDVLDWPGYEPTGYRILDKHFVIDGAFKHTFTLPQIHKEYWKAVERPNIMSACHYCCKFESSSVKFLTPLEFKNCDFFQYPILEQNWHPVTLTRDVLAHSLQAIFSSAYTIETRHNSIHHTHSLNSKCISSIKSNRFIIVDVSDMHSEYCNAKLVFETSLHNRLPLLLALAESMFSQSGQACCFIVSSPVVKHLKNLSSPVSHQLMCFLSHSTQLENVKKHGEKVSGISYLQQVCVDMIMDILQLKQDEIEWKKELKDDPLQSDVHVCKKLKLHRNGETVNIASIFEQSLHISNPNTSLIQSSSEQSVSPVGKELSENGERHAYDDPCVIKTHYTAMEYNTDELIICSFCIFELDTIAMLKYRIPDVRILWSKDRRFLEQFHALKFTNTFKQFSLFPSRYVHDVSFWVDKPSTNGAVRQEDENDKKNECIEKELQEQIELQFFPLVRQMCGDSVVSVDCIDVYNPSKISPNYGRISYCYRVVYMSCDLPLGSSEAHVMQQRLREGIQLLGWKLR